MYFNQVTLVGRLTADPELKMIGESKQVAQFTIAVSRPFKDKDGNKQTDFFNIVAWDKTAKFVVDYMAKGKLILVSGSIQNRQWTDNNNVKRTATEIVANAVTPMEKMQATTPVTETEAYDYK